ncbi:hypothetical protein ACA910_015121 [Epithemia clementina (nom. ined.)]
MTEQVHGEPYDGMMCLCTMEEITLEDGNYVEYQCYPSLKWKPCLYEKSIVEKLLSEQFTTFVERVKKTDCQAELRRLLAAGPPIWLEDKHALPLEEGDTHVVQLWFADENREISAKLQGALEGEERQKLWNELKQFIIEEGKEKGDDDDGDENNNKE